MNEQSQQMAADTSGPLPSEKSPIARATDKEGSASGEGQKEASTNDVQERAKGMAAAFGEIVALLGRSRLFRHISLTDLEWLVIPPLVTNQVATVRGNVKDQYGFTIPLGLVLWAHVSVEVDKKLEAQKQVNIPFRLAPHEWKSGEIPWLLSVIGPTETMKALIHKLETTVFKDKTLEAVSIRDTGSGKGERIWEGREGYKAKS